MARSTAEIWRDLEGFEKPDCPRCGESHHVALDEHGFYCEACGGTESIPNGSEFDDILEELESSR